CGRCGACCTRDPHSQVSPASSHHPALRDYRDPSAAVSHYGILSWGRALRSHRDERAGEGARGLPLLPSDPCRCGADP
ncbi:unnamed protein product, partial [Polarella glacialis]